MPLFLLMEELFALTHLQPTILQFWGDLLGTILADLVELDNTSKPTSSHVVCLLKQVRSAPDLPQIIKLSEESTLQLLFHVTFIDEDLQKLRK